MANIDELRNELEEDLQGLRICDYISRKDVNEYLNNFDEWGKTAKSGDTYYAQGFSYTYEPEYELAVWRDAEQRDVGEPIYMTPTCSSTDLEAIKKECEAYDITSTGCIEIFVVGEDESFIHYENGEWSL